MSRSPGKPRVSVVVPVQNSESTIAACIEALLAQSYPRELCEIVIVDNDSTDGTHAVASRYPVTLLTESEIHTSYAARNRGIAHAAGEIIAFTDADCVPAADWLAQLVTPFDDLAVGAAVGGVDDAPPASLCEEFTARVKPFARPVRNGLQTLLTVNVAIRRSVLETLERFDERLPTAGDVDLGWRLQDRGFRLADAPAAVVRHRHRSTFREVFRQYRRYGLSEALLATLHPGRAGRLNVRQMFSQLRAMGSYIAALAFRSAVSLLRGFDRRYVLWPLFLLTVESGAVAGKLEGLLKTRGCRRNPFPNPRLGRTARIMA